MPDKRPTRRRYTFKNRAYWVSLAWTVKRALTPSSNSNTTVLGMPVEANQEDGPYPGITHALKNKQAQTQPPAPITDPKKENGFYPSITFTPKKAATIPHASITGLKHEKAPQQANSDGTVEYKRYDYQQLRSLFNSHFPRSERTKKLTVVKEMLDFAIDLLDEKKSSHIELNPLLKASLKHLKSNITQLINIKVEVDDLNEKYRRLAIANKDQHPGKNLRQLKKELESKTKTKDQYLDSLNAFTSTYQYMQLGLAQAIQSGATKNNVSVEGSFADIAKQGIHAKLKKDGHHAGNDFYQYRFTLKTLRKEAQELSNPKTVAHYRPKTIRNREIKKQAKENQEGKSLFPDTRSYKTGRHKSKHRHQLNSQTSKQENSSPEQQPDQNSQSISTTKSRYSFFSNKLAGEKPNIRSFVLKKFGGR